MLSLGALAACNAKETAAAPAAEVNNPDKNFGLQIYTLGNELYAGNLADNFKRLNGMGFKYIELAGYDVNTNKVGGVDFSEFKKMANDAGLAIPSSHVNAPGLFSGVAGRESRDGSDGQFNRSMIDKVAESFKKVADDHAAQGIEYVVHPMMAYLNTEDDVKAFAGCADRIPVEYKFLLIIGIIVGNSAVCIGKVIILRAPDGLVIRADCREAHNLFSYGVSLCLCPFGNVLSNLQNGRSGYAELCKTEGDKQRNHSRVSRSLAAHTYGNTFVSRAGDNASDHSQHAGLER